MNLDASGSLQHDDFVREFHLQVAARQASDALDAILKDPRAVSDSDL